MQCREHRCCVHKLDRAAAQLPPLLEIGVAGISSQREDLHLAPEGLCECVFVDTQGCMSVCVRRRRFGVLMPMRASMARVRAGKVCAVGLLVSRFVCQRCEMHVVWFCWFDSSTSVPRSGRGHEAINIPRKTTSRAVSAAGLVVQLETRLGGECLFASSYNNITAPADVFPWLHRLLTHANSMNAHKDVSACVCVTNHRSCLRACCSWSAM